VDDRIDASKLVWQTLDGLISFERDGTCLWKQTSKKKTSLFSFLFFSPNEGLFLVTELRPHKFVRITDDDFSFGSDPKDLKAQAQGSWLNGLTLKELDADLSDSKTNCALPASELIESK
jgi:hypothetical protein